MLFIWTTHKAFLAMFLPIRHELEICQGNWKHKYSPAPASAPFLPKQYKKIWWLPKSIVLTTLYLNSPRMSSSKITADEKPRTIMWIDCWLSLTTSPSEKQHDTNKSSRHLGAENYCNIIDMSRWGILVPKSAQRRMEHARVQ